ncbi:hypothetical protein ACFX2C_011151 [Malus domestica]
MDLVMNRQPISVGNVPPATVKVEPSTLIPWDLVLHSFHLSILLPKESRACRPLHHFLLLKG